MSAFQIKCYLLEDNVNVSASRINEANEIRRFALVNSPSGLYDHLIEKIQSAYGTLLPNKHEIKTYWLDEENDLVCFSTDSETQYAIDVQTAVRMSNQFDKNIPSSVFKVYISRKSVQDKVLPLNENVDDTEQHIHEGIVCDGCNGSIRGIRFNCTVCADYDLCSNCQSKGIHKEHSFVKLEKPSKGKCPYSSENKGLFGKWKGQSNTCSTSNQIKETLNNFLPFISKKMPTVKDQEQLKNVGEYLKQCLDPFGIDVNYDVDRHYSIDSNANNKESESRQTNDKQNEDSLKHESKMDESSIFEEIKPSKNMAQEKSESFLSQSRFESSLTKAYEANSKDDTIIEPTNTGYPSAPVKDDLIDLKLLNLDASSNGFKNDIKCFDDLEKVSHKKEAFGLRKPDDCMDYGFNLVDIEKEVNLLNSIELLKLMGYSDDGGFLSQLVISKNGNLNAVLDELLNSK